MRHAADSITCSCAAARQFVVTVVSFAALPFDGPHLMLITHTGWTLSQQLVVSQSSATVQNTADAAVTQFPSSGCWQSRLGAVGPGPSQQIGNLGNHSACLAGLVMQSLHCQAGVVLA